MSKIAKISVAAALLALSSTPALSAEAWQAFQCELIDEATESDVIAGAKKWLAAARTMKGGENMQLSVHFPVAAASAEFDFVFILKAPSFADWGMFWDGYEGSPANEVDKESDAITVCPSARLFEAVEIQPE